MFTSGKADDDSRLIEFHRDCELTQQSLMVDLIETTSAGAQHFFDNLHCSPIKVQKYDSFVVLLRSIVYIEIT